MSGARASEWGEASGAKTRGDDCQLSWIVSKGRAVGCKVVERSVAITRKGRCDTVV